MAPTLLLVAVLGFVIKPVLSQVMDYPWNVFGDTPPLPEKGVRLYQGVLNRAIPNYAMVAARDFSDRDGGSDGLGGAGALDGMNDGLWCQSANSSSDIGSWKLPNGSSVSDNLPDPNVEPYLITEPIHMASVPGQVGLLRSESIGSSPYQGMYTCTIFDENGVSQTLVVWAAGVPTYDGISQIVVTEASIIQSKMPKDTDPPELIVSFDVKVAPPTYVTCQVDSNPVDVAILSREVTAGQYLSSNTTSPVTNVNVTLRTRQAGNYQCSVSVFRASGANLTDVKTTPISILGQTARNSLL